MKNNNNFINFNKSTMIYKMVNNNSYKYNKLMKFRRKIKFYRQKFKNKKNNKIIY